MVIERSLHGRLGGGLDYGQSIFQRTIVPELLLMLERLGYELQKHPLVLKDYTDWRTPGGISRLEEETKLNIFFPVTKYFQVDLA